MIRGEAVCRMVRTPSGKVFSSNCRLWHMKVASRLVLTACHGGERGQDSKRSHHEFVKKDTPFGRFWECFSDSARWYEMSYSEVLRTGVLRNRTVRGGWACFKPEYAM